MENMGETWMKIGGIHLEIWIKLGFNKQKYGDLTCVRLHGVPQIAPLFSLVPEHKRAKLMLNPSFPLLRLPSLVVYPVSRHTHVGSCLIV